jgi:hypothetical protein
MRNAPVALSLATSLAAAAEGQWTSRDYVDFYFRHYNGHVPLPRLRNAAQENLFNHLVDPAISAALFGTERHRLDKTFKQMKQALSAAP